MIKTRKEYRKYLEKEIGVGIKRIYHIMTKPSYEAVYLIRKSQYYYGKNYFYRFISYCCKRKLQSKYGIFINPKKRIGIGLRIPHPNSIIIGTNEIGENCTIFQQVTIGSARFGDAKSGLQPQIGDDCTFFAGCKVLGNIKVANGTVVGANAVLTKDTEENSTYVGVPAKKVIKK